jgi:hypothetical protein
MSGEKAIALEALSSAFIRSFQIGCCKAPEVLEANLLILKALCYAASEPIVVQGASPFSPWEQLKTH